MVVENLFLVKVFIGWAAKIHLTWNECFHVLNLLELFNMIALSGT